MWEIIITAVVFIVLTVSIITDTHIIVYWPCSTRIIREYNFELPLWLLLLIIFIYCIPFVNIMAFLCFLIYYIIHVVKDPSQCEDDNRVFSLNGNNWVTKQLLIIKKILNKKIL